jgi:putative mycofactocin binding protein MftB
VTVAAPSVAERSFGGLALALHAQVALRPEPFGALLYHYGTRRLVFLKHPDVVRVVKSLADHPNVGETLAACGIDARRRPAFVAALQSLVESEMLHDRVG